MFTVVDKLGWKQYPTDFNLSDEGFRNDDEEQMGREQDKILKQHFFYFNVICSSNLEAAVWVAVCELVIISFVLRYVLVRSPA